MGKFRIIIGDITSDEILENHDLIINPTNPQMVAGAGVSGAIFKKAGVNLLEQYTQKIFDINYFSDNYNKNNIMNVGEVRITPGFNLGMDIMFVQGPNKWDYDDPNELLYKTYKNTLDEIKNNNYKNVLFCSLGTGDYGFEHYEIGKQVYKILNDFVMNNDINIDLVLYDEKYKIYYCE